MLDDDDDSVDMGDDDHDVVGDVDDADADGGLPK